ncbi:hypothetical protein [Actinomadura nitritigenes]|uniref:hypothetical protein n=1 Tax=Actinomadura nitritigenes TaxID=134602 RepID=UPI003D8ACB87
MGDSSYVCVPVGPRRTRERRPDRAVRPPGPFRVRVVYGLSPSAYRARETGPRRRD